MRIARALICVGLIAMARPAAADGLIVPFIGYDFGGDAGDCGDATDCSSKQVAYGGSLGFMVGGFLGIEGDFGYAPHFFGEGSSRGDNHVLTVTGNLLVGIPAGAVRPYTVGGVGVIHTDIARSDVGIYDAFTNNDIAFDVGGGLLVFFARHIGMRADLRYFRSFEDTTFLPFAISEAKLDFWRGSLGVTFRF